MQFIIALLLAPNIGFAQDSLSSKKEKPLQNSPAGADKSSIVQNPGDSAKGIKTDSLKLKPKTRSDFKTTVKYHAKDSIRFDVPTSIVRLYGDAWIEYDDMKIKAERIEINYKTNTVTASGTPDSLGNMFGEPTFKQGSDEYELEKIVYNFKTQKGLISGVVTKQGEGYIQGNKIKKMPNNDMYVRDATYTTCNASHPHFGFHATRIKVIPGDRIIAGAGYLGLGAIPTPLVFPFGFFPSTNRRSSGILIPSIGESASSGFYIEKLGFYWATNPYMGIKSLNDIYTNGSWRTDNTIDYYSRYAFRGMFNVKYSDLKQGFVQSTTLPAQKQAQIVWSHAPIGKGTGKLSANVNMGLGSTTSYYRQNSSDARSFSNNTFSSNVNYSKSFTGTPFNLNVAARQNQNVSSQTFDAELVNIGLTMNQLRPLQNTGKKANAWYKTLSVAYNMNFNNKYSNTSSSLNVPFNYNIKYINEGDIIRPTDSLVFARPKIDSSLLYMWDKSRYGLQHTVPINVSFKVFKYISVNPTVNITSTWYDKKINYRQIDTNTYAVSYKSGFNAPTTYTANVNFTTRVYGTKLFKGKVQAVRHILTPTVGFAYNPNYTKNEGFYQKISNVSEKSNAAYYLPYYSGSEFIYGGPTGTEVSAMTFSLDNVLEMKVKTKNDTTSKSNTKKVSLIDNFNINGNYNFAADSINLSNISLNVRTNLFKIVNFNFVTSFDPYYYKPTSYNPTTGEVASQVKTKYYLYDVTGGSTIARMSLINVALSTTLNPKARKKGNQLTPEEIAFYRMYPYQRYVDFKLPWNASASINYSYNKTGFIAPNETFTLQTSGDLRVTDNWKLGFTNLGYDFAKETIVPPQLNIFRDLHCWIMSFNWAPYSPYMTYSFSLNVKASSLQDLKIPKRGLNY